MKKLGEELAKPIVEDRAANHRITRVHRTRCAIKCILGKLKDGGEYLQSEELAMSNQ